VLTVVGVIVKLVLDDIGKPDTCPSFTGNESDHLSPLSQGRWEKVVASGHPAPYGCTLYSFLRDHRIRRRGLKIQLQSHLFLNVQFGFV
jgi:hypothetical protein